MHKSKTKDDFLRKPQYIGGDKAMKEFVAKNLRYPEEAVAAKVEGRVLVGYDVLDSGKVINPHIIHGIGYGCDEEALRLVGLFRFSKVKNRKLRVKVSKRTSINFKLQQTKISYTLKSDEKPKSADSKPDQDKESSGYSYTIKF